jgi:dimeric dUTPase (all-alpha-NTP-PPase superfamily)
MKMLKNSTIMYLLEFQKDIDERIREEFEIKPDDIDILRKKMIAFFVEIGEFINEERSFKYWSRKKENDRQKVLEEYVDGLHFVLSLGLDIKYDFENHKPFVEKGDLYDTYLNLIHNLGTFVRTISHWEFRKVFSNFLAIADVLKLRESQIEKAYLSKNKKNHKRQDDKY